MKIELIDKKIKEIKADLELVFIINKELKHKWINKNDFRNRNFQGETDKTVLVEEKKILYIGIPSLNHENLRVGTSLAVRCLDGFKFKSLKLGLYGEGDGNIQSLTEGFILGFYFFDRYLSEKKKNYLKDIIISTEEFGDLKIESFEKLKKTIKEAEIIARSVNYARDLVNMPPSELTPIKLSSFARDLAKENNLKVKIFGEKYLEEEGMGAFLAVSKASPYPPQLIHLVYKPKKAKKKIALVGKGLTYDSGGLSLNPSTSMTSMKSDESGASAILGVMQAVSKLNLPYEVHGIVGATENVVGKHAYKPDDILRAKNGKTIEVKNTDAEGRLVLADCLSYAQDLKPDYVLDIATLTGAVVVALGEYTRGIMGNDKNLKNSLCKASLDSGELCTQLHFNRYLRPLLKSDVADVSNISSSSFGGAITAALFLDQFIDKKYKDKWAHLDIAGPAFVKKPWGYNPPGGSGAGVRLIIQWLKNLK
ncbi:leucyl aminopeptidase [bacterium]|nr:leucyl aminopeptidase [bacterium]